ncbi:Uncharacterised protein [Klebsiella pneumoniae]|nr:Uncharacterised protein [Klebsiella pneumoniae]
MEIDETVEAEMQMALVRICRQERNARGVWLQMKKQFPEFELEDIKKAVRPVILRMMDSL